MNGANYEVPHCGAFSTPHSHPSWVQIFASVSFFQISLVCIPPEEGKTAFKILTGTLTGKRPLGKPRRRWEGIFKIDLKEICLDMRNSVDSVQDRYY